MKTFVRFALSSLFLVGVAGLSFVAGSAENFRHVTTYTRIADQTTIGSVEVGVTPDLRAWFQSNGVDGSKIDAPLASVEVTYKDALDLLVNDTTNRAALTSLINPILKAALVRGEIEVATMHIGRNLWTMSIDGPEDHS